MLAGLAVVFVVLVGYDLISGDGVSGAPWRRGVGQLVVRDG